MSVTSCRWVSVSWKQGACPHGSPQHGTPSVDTSRQERSGASGYFPVELKHHLGGASGFGVEAELSAENGRKYMYGRL